MCSVYLALPEMNDVLGTSCASSSRFAVFGFGQMTFNALKVFQADNSLLVDGVYGNISKNKLEGLMQG
jgi:hypothetical protein